MPIAPLKHPREIPETLFYYTKSGPQKQYDIFNMFSTRNGKRLGMLVLQKGKVNIENYYNGDILLIDFISSFQPQNGYGETMLNLSKNIAKKNNCNGHIMLKADTSFLPQKIPHLFYRKNDFTTLDKKLDKKMDTFIKKDKCATYKDFPCLLMYYPAPQKTPSKWSLFINSLKKIFSH